MSLISSDQGRKGEHARRVSTAQRRWDRKQGLQQGLDAAIALEGRCNGCHTRDANVALSEAGWAVSTKSQ